MGGKGDRVGVNDFYIETIHVINDLAADDDFVIDGEEDRVVAEGGDDAGFVQLDTADEIGAGGWDV